MAREDLIEQIAQGYVAAKKYSGIEWRVEAAGKPWLSGQVGYADALAQTPIPDGAIYRIYSMTKPIVSTLALILMEQGKLRLYDMLAQYDQRFAQMRVLTPDGDILPAARPITVDDLLTHRSGFTYDFIHGCHVAQYYRDARIIADALGLFGLTDDKEATRLKWTRIMSTVWPWVALVSYLFVQAPVLMIIGGGIAQALMLPILGVAALYFRYRRTDERLGKTLVWTVLLWISFIGFMIAGSWSLYSTIWG